MARASGRNKSDDRNCRTFGVFAIVLIDQRPLRDEARAECQAAMSRLELARAAWHHFERKDKPAFIRWRAREFGALLSEARETEQQIREKETLVYEVELEMRRRIMDPHSAYERVMSRQTNSAPEEPVADDGSGRQRRVTEFEQETLFQDWIKKFMGTNPDKMDDDAYSATFAAFKSHMFANRPPEPLPNEYKTKNEPRGFAVEEEMVPPPDARVKELYRLLVRRLHPDLRADGSSAVSNLWHEVQEAYAMGDTGRMEILLALSDIEANAVGEQTSLAQIRAVLAELARAFDALDRSLHEARRDDAWEFARKGPNDELRSEVGRELERNLGTRKSRLATLRQIIADWACPPRVNRRVLRFG
jgi:hypothetical protein